MTYFLALVIIVVPLALVVFLRERRWRRRESAIRALLDGADRQEAQLLECRDRMQSLRGMLVDLPEEMIVDADVALAADDKVQAALRELLQHRLWIQQRAVDASQKELDNAVAALDSSRFSIGQQLTRLAEITSALRAAQGR